MKELTQSQASRILGVSSQTVKGMADRGTIKRKINKMYDQDEVNRVARILSENRAKPRPQWRNIE